MSPFRVPAAAGVLCSAIVLSAVLATHAKNTTMTPSLSSSSSSSCEPATCGALRIEYPFWLGGTHPPDCGYRAYQVSCDSNGTASLQNSIWTYQILEISNRDSTFRVTNAQLSDGTCDIELWVNACSDLDLAPFGISAANQELFSLYDCTDLRRPPPHTWAPVNCASDEFLDNSFAWLAGGYKPDDKRAPVPGNCAVSMVPVLGYPGATGADHSRLIKGGFLLN